MPSGLTETRRVKDFLPLVRQGKQEGIFPISGMTLADIAAHLPHMKVEDSDADSSNLNVILADDHPSFDDQYQEGDDSARQ